MKFEELKLILFRLYKEYFRKHLTKIIIGLVLSILLMAFAATLISNWIKKYKWIAWAGLLAILIVAIDLIYTDIQILFL